jgi:sulfate adenylyltransferase large subunit
MSDLLRLATAGSVDDGKSTLVGRLLYDTKSVLADQLDAVTRASADRGLAVPDLSLLVDGLRSEREQGITIDVAYRYFATPARSFVLADTPGHVQYTRNTVTGASTAQLAVLLVDARRGVVEQTRRHAAVVALLGVPRLVLAVNKIDLVDYDEATFALIAKDFLVHATALGYQPEDVVAVPLSALVGDNVVHPSERTPWYTGPTLLTHLETVPIEPDSHDVPLRFPVQYVIRPQTKEHHDYRGYAGQVAGGVLKPGDTVTVLPSGFSTTIEAIDGLDGPVAEAYSPMSVVVRLADNLDISRGDMLCRPKNMPTVTQDIDAMVAWMINEPLRVGAKLVIKHTTRSARALVKEIQYRLDVNSLHRDESTGELGLNDIGRVRLRTTVPLFVDDYRNNRATGGFILIDEATNVTVGAGMISDVSSTG